MLSLTLHVPHPLADDVATVLADDPYILNVVRLAGACTQPSGDVITCMLPRESVAQLLDSLAQVGFDEHAGTITMDERLIVLGAAATDAARRARGAPDDALLWPALRASTSVAIEISYTYLAFMVLATLLAAIGLVTSSSVLVVGAMILGPEFGALAHLCVSGLGRDLRGIRAALWQLLVGFSVAIAATAAAAWLADLTGLVAVDGITREFERAIVAPSGIGLVIAVIAGIAGVLTLTSAKGEALIGVLVSVTTIPAAADLALGVASGDGSRIGNGAATLGINLAGMVVAGALTLALYRRAMLGTRTA